MNTHGLAKTKPSQARSVPPVSSNFSPRKCACGDAAALSGECDECRKRKRLGLQAKLKLNEPGYSDEQEADRLAERGPTSGAGRPGEPPLRANVNPRFGYDFSGVPVHAVAMSPLALLGQARNALIGSLGEGAGRIPIEIASTETKGAEGVTVGRRVHLAPGRFDTRSYEGRVRLGHEVAHAIQQERGAGLSSALAPVHRAALETEAERAGRAFADGRRFSVMGKAPTTAELFRGPSEEQKPEADEELDAAIQEVSDRQAARGADIERDRKERHDYIRAHLEWSEYYVPVDKALKRTAPARQPHELWMRVLEIAFPGIAREDAEEILRRTGIKDRSVESVWSVESDSIAEQIRTRDKIYFRTQYMPLFKEIYNEIGEDRVRASLNVDELLNAGPDMALEMFKDVGRGYYNGILGFGQGLLDLPLAPVNLYESLTGGEQRHILDLSGLRAHYHTSYGVHNGSDIELGTQVGLTMVSGRLPAGAGAGTGAAASTASQASRAARLFSTWTKLNAVSAGATAVVQAGQAMRDIARGYVIEDGKRRQLTEDDILGRLAGIAFGVHVAKSALRSTPGKSGSEPASTPAPAVPDMIIERTTPSKIQVSVPGEPGKLVIDDAGWHVLAADGEVLAQGSRNEGALLASRLGEAQAAQPVSPVTAPAPPSPDTRSGQTAQAPQPATTLSVLQGGGQYSGKPRGLAFDADLTSRSVRVDTSHPIFKNRRPANDQDLPPAPQAKAMQAGAAAAREAADMPKVEAVLGASHAGDTVEPAHMGPKVPSSSPAVGSVSSDVQTSPPGKPEPEPTPPLGSATETVEPPAAAPPVAEPVPTAEPQVVPSFGGGGASGGTVSTESTPAAEYRPPPDPASPSAPQPDRPQGPATPPAPGPLVVDIQGGPAVQLETGQPAFLPSTVAGTPGARGVLLEAGDLVPGYAGITTTNARDLAMVRILSQNLPQWPASTPGVPAAQPQPWIWDPRIAFPPQGPVSILRTPGAPGTTPVPQAFFPPLGGDVVPGVPRLIPTRAPGRTAQQDVSGLQPSMHPELHGQVDRAYLRRPFALASANAETIAAMGREIGQWLRPGGFLELRLLRGGEAAQAEAIAQQIPNARVVTVPRGAITAYARSGQRPAGLTDEQWTVLQEAGPDIRGEFGAYGEGQFARIIRIYRGSPDDQ
jgi:hypothetical protein